MRQLPILFVIIVLASCKEQLNDGNAKVIGENIKAANQLILEENQIMYWNHENNLKDPQTASLEAFWHPAIKTVVELSANARQYINNLAGQIRSLPKDKPSALGKLMKKEGQILYNSLYAFNKGILAIINPAGFKDKQSLLSFVQKDIAAIQQQNTIRLNGGDTLVKIMFNEEKWLQQYWGDASSAITLTMLEKLTSDVLLTENALLSLIQESCSKEKITYANNIPLVVLSNHVANPGDTLSLQAAVGSLSNIDSLKITIGGHLMVNVGLTAVQKIVAGNKPGKYKVPVVFQYKEVDGTSNTITLQAEYTVVL